jgi:flagellar motility protein MotE (MotC chaperone)
MMRGLAVPRLLPLTITAMAALLAFKSIGLVRATLPSERPPGIVVAAAQAAGAEQAAGARPEQPAPAKPAVPTASALSAEPPPIPDSERAILLELRERRRGLDLRESALAARESVLAAAEQRLTERAGELAALQRQLQALEAKRSEREEASWQGLVKVYETMKPRDAATILNDLAQPVLLNVLDRMKEAKAAPLLAAMNPDKAREITADLAQLRSRRNTSPNVAVPTSAPPVARKTAG